MSWRESSTTASSAVRSNGRNPVAGSSSSSRVSGPGRIAECGARDTRPSTTGWPAREIRTLTRSFSTNSVMTPSEACPSDPDYRPRAAGVEALFPIQNQPLRAENGGDAGSAPSPGTNPLAALVLDGLGPEFSMARIDAILKLVKQQGASDLHLTTGSPPMVRINGEIVPVPYEQLTAEVIRVLLFELMDADLRARFERERDVDFSYEVPGVLRLRCNIYEQSRGMAGAFRLLSDRILTLEQLGLPPHVSRFTELNRGLVLVTGPPGTGKSSTLAAMIDHINRTQPKHILTLEDP